MSVLHLAVFSASIAFAIYHFFWLERPAGHLRAVLKTAPVLLLVLYALVAQAPLLLIVALAFAALGDACLAYEGEPAFIAGLLAFLAAHLVYVALFWPLATPPLLFGSPWRYAAGWIFVVLMATVLFLSWRPAGRLAIPIAVYALAVVAMALSALMLRRVLPPIGATLFVISDTALAIQIFLTGSNAAIKRKLKPLVWGSYYAAQLAFTLAFAGWRHLY